MGARAAGHKWQFVRAGSVDQVSLRHARDLARLAELDQKAPAAKVQRPGAVVPTTRVAGGSIVRLARARACALS